MHPKDAKGIANSVGPDQTAPLIIGGGQDRQGVCGKKQAAYLGSSSLKIIQFSL